MDKSKLDRFLEIAQSSVAVITSLLFLYTAFFGSFEAVIQRSLLLLSAILWAFIYFARKAESNMNKMLYLFFGAIAIFPTIYLIYAWDDIVMRYGIPLNREYIIGGILVSALLFVGKRFLGWGFTIIVLVFIAYALLGQHLPGVFKHNGISLERLLSTTFLTTQGIFGTVMNVAATIIIQFVIFASFLRIWGAGDFFMNITSSVFGAIRGGPAKLAVIGSGLTGTFSGVATANVATTGSITIPLMKKNGYSPEFAGGVEAAASTGGQILPPIMGASAFVMAETLGIPISEVMKAALVPALLFFFAIYLAVDFRAAKENLVGLKKEELPNFKKTLKKGWLYIVPIFVLVLMIFQQFSPGRAVIFAILSLLIIGFFIKDNKVTWAKIAEALKSGAEDTVIVTIACAMAGIVIGILNVTGLGVALGNLLITLSAGIFILLLLFTALASIVLGMGLPTIAGYIIVSLTVAPVLVSNFGIEPIAAHMFVFYFAILSVITPPVAVASYVAAGIAKSNPVKTGLVAFAIAIPCFIVPFIFIYNPELLMIGNPLSIIWKILIGVLSVYCLAAGIQGFHRKNLHSIIRITFFLIALLLIIPNLYLTLLGIALFLTIVIVEHKQILKDKYASAA